MKRLIDMLFPMKPDPRTADEIKRLNTNLEQLRDRHQKATRRADRAMTESVKIAQEALRTKPR